MAFYLILVRTSIVQKEVVESPLWLKIKKKFHICPSDESRQLKVKCAIVVEAYSLEFKST